MEVHSVFTYILGYHSVYMSVPVAARSKA